MPCDESQLKDHVKQCRILDGHSGGVVGDDALIDFWNMLKERNALSCKQIFNELRK